jgi:hypothetical protein
MSGNGYYEIQVHGEGMGSDPGFGVEFTTEQSLAARASHCDIYPFVGGLWAYRPPPGYLEPLEASDG